MGHQVALTVQAAIRPDALAPLQRLLDAMSADAAHNEVLPFGELEGTHFGRLLIVDACTASPTLLLMLDCDAPLERRLAQLVRVAGDGLDRIFSHCAGYPSSGAAPSEGARLDYLRTRLVPVPVFYVHTVGRTLEQVRGEARLRRSIGRFLDASRDSLAGGDALEVRAAIRSFVAADPTLAWALEPAPPPELAFRLREAAHMIGWPALLLVLWPLLLPAAGLWVAALRAHELRDPSSGVRLDPARLRELAGREDYLVQNQVSTLAPVKPARFWRLTASVFLGVAGYSARHLFNKGSLAGLRTVHFARFMRFPGPDRVLFTSSYDGSLESYMNDFIDKVAWVLNGVFGNEEGYPRTRWLFGAGARDELGFKDFLRGHQIPTQVWYSAYGDLSAANVDNNASVRAGLSGDLGRAEAEAWLRRL